MSAWVRAGFGAAVVMGLGAACGSSGAEASGEGGAGGGSSAQAVDASTLCAALADIACGANDACCDVKAVPGGAGGATDTSGSGGAGGSGGAEGVAGGAGGVATTTSSTTATAAPDCATRERAACEATLGRAAKDPRTGYDPERGGAFVEALRAAATGCFAEPMPYALLAAAMTGTGELGASCTPDDASLASLHLAAVSCKGGARCHLYLRASGEPEGVCEAPTGDGCSHPYDCASGSFCDLPSDWRPGVWGTCRPLRGDGWKCASDLECQSAYCAGGTCTPSGPSVACLVNSYADAVAADSPVAWWRLGETSGGIAKDVLGRHDGAREGGPSASAPGAIAGDADGATAFDGDDDRVSVIGPVTTTPKSFSLEAWVAFKKGTEKVAFLAFGEPTSAGPSIGVSDKGDAFVADLVDADGASHAATGPKGELGAGSWHHLAITYDGARGVLYVDGEEAGSVEGDFVPRVTGPLTLGASAAGEGFRGRLDEVAVYTAALSKGRIAAHHARGKHGPEAADFRAFGFFR